MNVEISIFNEISIISVNISISTWILKQIIYPFRPSYRTSYGQRDRTSIVVFHLKVLQMPFVK